MAFDTLNFLKHYKNFPCLWDKNLPDFRNRQKRSAAEEILLPISRLSNIKELRAKIRSIRGTYNQEVIKIRSSMRTGYGTKDIYKPKLYWFSYADSFLRKNLEQDNMQSESNLILNCEIVTDDTSQNFINEEHQVNELKQEQDVSLQIQPRKRSLRNTLKSNSIKITKQEHFLDEVSSSSSHFFNSEFTVFGQLIATQLAQLPLEEAIHLQQEIQTKINEARLKHIRNSSYNPSLPSTSSSMHFLSNSAENSYATSPLASPCEETSFN